MVTDWLSSQTPIKCCELNECGEQIRKGVLGKKGNLTRLPLTQSCHSTSPLTMLLFMPFMLTLLIAELIFFLLCLHCDGLMGPCEQFQCVSCLAKDGFLYMGLGICLCPLFLFSFDKNRLRGCALILLSGILIRGEFDSSSNFIFSLTHPRW